MGGKSISLNNEGFYVKYTPYKSLATFLPFFDKFGIQNLLSGAVLQAPLSQISSKNSLVNPWVGKSISLNN
jgi:hypothetical protein